VDYLHYWSAKTRLPTTWLVDRLGIGRSRYYDWRRRYGRVNEHNAWIPRDHWLLEEERQAILDFYRDHDQDGYRRVTYMMMDADLVAVSPSSVYRVLKAAGLLRAWARKASKKGTGFHQPTAPHQHWHTDISYINLCGTFYYLCTVLDGFSRYVLHWEIRQQMTCADVQIVLQRAREGFPGVNPRVISDNGPQFIANDFKEFIRLAGMSHVRTSPFYPQSNGKQERWFHTLKADCLRPGCPLSLDDARRLLTAFVAYYNNVRLHSAIDYVTPNDKLEGRAPAILAQREAKLHAARTLRAQRRRQLRLTTPTQQTTLEPAHPHHPSPHAATACSA
jgi:transposase InsO family protein